MAEAPDTVPAQQQTAARVATTTTATASDVSASASAWLQQVLALLFPSNLAAKAALFALVVALLPLLPPSGQQQAPRIWELPHLLLLGIIISYGVFGQKNADAAEVAAAADAKPVDDDEAAVEAYVSQMMQGSLVFEGNDGGDDDCASKDGGGGVQQAWSSQYLPDDPLVVVADTSSGSSGINSGNADTDTGEKEKPLLLPVRKLKPAADESAPAATPAQAGDLMSDSSGIEEEEEEELLLARKAGTGYDVVRKHAIPSPSSVLDADLTLSPSSSPPLLPPPPPPPPPPFLGCERRRSRLLKAKARSFNEFGALSSSNRSPNATLGSHRAVGAGSKQFRSRSAAQATRSAFGRRRYDPVVPIDVDDEADDETLGDEIVAASDSPFSSDLDDDDTIIKEENSREDDNGVDEDEDNSCDEELFELATRPGPEGEAEAETETETEEVEDEVDRKADEFIAKFREQIRMQRVEPARR